MSSPGHIESLSKQEEETISRSSTPTLSLPNSPQDPVVSSTITSLNVAPSTSITSVPSSPTAGSSRVSPFLIVPRSLIRHPSPMITEPIAQRRRVEDNLATLQHLVNAMNDERIEIIEEFNRLHERQIRVEDIVGTLRLELEASARREEALRKVLEESQGRVVRLEENMKSFQGGQKKKLEEMVAKADAPPSTSHP